VGLEKLGIIAQIRKGRVLTASDFGCLKGIPTLNVTNGCLFQCAYCYARGYSQAPRRGEVRLYVNLPDLLKKELAGSEIFLRG
jgi:DNA repair photolyase